MMSHNFFSSLCNSTNIIIAGDFNTIINPEIDRSSISSNIRNWHSTEIIKYIEHYGLGDNWRMSNPTSRECTYFSSLHQSFFSNRPLSYQ
uniref:Endonuclease/exonuclease/phosphatase domain-containing protein n=1 Tax=Monopterus albus TaxID=43700 RepID=A0A3Q3RBD7_MONAL